MAFDPIRLTVPGWFFTDNQEIEAIGESGLMREDGRHSTQALNN
jgi:hypothetical protein